MPRKRKKRSFFGSTDNETNVIDVEPTPEEKAEIELILPEEEAEIELILPVNGFVEENEIMLNKIKQKKQFCFCNSLQSFCSELDSETQEPVYSGRNQQEALKFTWEEMKKYVEETEHIGVQFAIIRVQ